MDEPFFLLCCTQAPNILASLHSAGGFGRRVGPTYRHFSPETLVERSAAANTPVQTPDVIPDARIVSISARSIRHEVKRIDECLDYDGVIDASLMHGL